MNTHESYVSFETAKLLKQAGFDWETEFGQHIWDIGKRLETNRNFNSEKYLVSLPTLAIAQKWLRENREADINVLTDFDAVHRFYTVRYVIKLGHYKTFTINNERDCLQYFNTYEEAQEAGIKKALEIILKKGE